MANRVGIVWSKAPEDALFELTSAYADVIIARIRERLRDWAIEILRFMQVNAPWQDITGAARASLSVKPGGNQYGSWLILAHGVPYGPYLEGINIRTGQPMMNAGQWSIIEPTIDIYAQRIWQDIWGEFQR